MLRILQGCRQAGSRKPSPHLPCAVRHWAALEDPFGLHPSVPSPGKGWGCPGAPRAPGVAAPRDLPGVARLLEIQEPGHEHRGGAMGVPGGGGCSAPARGESAARGSGTNSASSGRASRRRGGRSSPAQPSPARHCPARPRPPPAPSAAREKRHGENKGDLREGRASPAAARRRRRRRRKKKKGGYGGNPFQLFPATATCAISLRPPAALSTAKNIPHPPRCHPRGIK